METLKFCIDLPKLKQRGKGKPGQNTSYDILGNNIEGSFILLNLLFFEEMSSSLNDFLVIFQTDNSTIHFTAGTLECIIRYLCSQFTRKEVLQYTSFSLDLCKIDVTDKKLSVDSVDLGFAIRHDIAILKKSRKITDNQLRKSSYGTLMFLEGLCSPFMEKSPSQYHLVRSEPCFSPNLMIQPQEINKTLFGKMLIRLVSYNSVSAAVADKAKIVYSSFILNTLKDNKSSFAGSNKSKRQLDTFLW